MRKIVKYSLFILCIFLFAGCATRTYQRTIPRSDTEITTILSVKNATHPFFEHKTYGEAFASFFALPKWKYFRSAIPEEGKILKKADKKEQSTVEVVEFSGICMYQYKRVKTKIQFLLNPENGTFRATYLSFNDVPQSIFMLQAIIEKAFTTEKFSTEVSVVSDEDAQKKQEEMERELQRQEELARKEAEEKERKRLEEEKKREEERKLAEKERYINYVKNGNNKSFPYQSYGTAFETFFSNTNWEYFEGRNEKGEIGKIVEFTGFCFYQNEHTFATVQFLINETENTFEIVSFQLGSQKIHYYEISQILRSIFSKTEPETRSIFWNEEFDNKDHSLFWTGVWQSTNRNGYMKIQHLGKDNYEVYIRFTDINEIDEHECFFHVNYGQMSDLLHYENYTMRTTIYNRYGDVYDIETRTINDGGIIDRDYEDHTIKWGGMIFTKME